MSFRALEGQSELFGRIDLAKGRKMFHGDGSWWEFCRFHMQSTSIALAILGFGLLDCLAHGDNNMSNIQLLRPHCTLRQIWEWTRDTASTQDLAYDQ